MSFWEKVDKRGPIVQAGLGNCWIWTGALYDKGYGCASVGGKVHRAHRLSFRIAHGRWPDPCCLHRCDNRACVRPSHLFEGTHADNALDKVLKGRQARGSKNGRAKLTSTAVGSIRNMLGTHLQIAKAFGVSRSTVSLIKAGKIWK